MGHGLLYMVDFVGQLKQNEENITELDYTCIQTKNNKQTIWHSDLCGNPDLEKTMGNDYRSSVIQGRTTIAIIGTQSSSPQTLIAL